MKAEMSKKEVHEYLTKLKERAEKELEKASLDSHIFGGGFVKINSDCEINHIPFDEITEELKKFDEETSK